MSTWDHMESTKDNLLQEKVYLSQRHHCPVWTAPWPGNPTAWKIIGSMSFSVGQTLSRSSRLGRGQWEQLSCKQVGRFHFCKFSSWLEVGELDWNNFVWEYGVCYILVITAMCSRTLVVLSCHHFQMNGSLFNHVSMMKHIQRWSRFPQRQDYVIIGLFVCFSFCFMSTCFFSFPSLPTLSDYQENSFKIIAWGLFPFKVLLARILFQDPCWIPPLSFPTDTSKSRHRKDSSSSFCWRLYHLASPSTSPLTP